MTHEHLNVSIAQMTSTDDLDQNLKQFFGLLESAPSDSDLLVFPENTFYLRLDRQAEAEWIQLSDSFISEVEAWVSESGTSILIGGTPIQQDGTVYNATMFFEPGKSGQVVYKKIHLFDVSVKGEKNYRESDDFTHGSQVASVEVKGWAIGLSICYDLRFPELFLNYYKQDVPVVIVPSAFLVETGKAHWEVLLRARAIEGQCYILAPAQAGEHKSNKSPKVRRTYGNSMIVGPWGEIMERADGESVGWLTTQLDKEKVNSVRQQIPMSDHRRI